MKWSDLEIGDVFQLVQDVGVYYVKIDETSQVNQNTLVISIHDEGVQQVFCSCPRSTWKWNNAC